MKQILSLLLKQKEKQMLFNDIKADSEVFSTKTHTHTHKKIRKSPEKESATKAITKS